MFAEKELTKKNISIRINFYKSSNSVDGIYIFKSSYYNNMVCRGLLLQLERSGYIQLPSVKFRPNNPLANRSKPAKIDIDKAPIYDYDQIEIKQVRRTPDEKL